MAKLTGKQIHDLVLEQLEKAPGGIRWTVLLRTLHAAHPETPRNSIQGATLKSLNSSPGVVKVARGIYQLSKYQDAQASVAVTQDEKSSGAPIKIEDADHQSVSLVEADFYGSFAQWLTDVAEEVNVAVALGGNVLKGKWGTPDVLGVLKPSAKDILKFETQIVSAEVKIDPNQPVIAFGQAVAYRLFSHKSYIVVPNTTSEDDLSRLKALCSIHGVGLVTFTLDPANPDYSVIVLPLQASPDMFYANTMLRRLLDAAQEQFDELFS